MSVVESLSRRFNNNSTLAYPGLWLVAIAFFITPFVGFGTIAIEIMAFAIVVVGFDLLIGYTGYVSFGQAMFFGSGAYATDMAVKFLGLSFIPAVVSGMLIGGILAAIVGALSFQRRGVYFSLLTLAFAQMVWTFLTVKSEFTGGTEGLSFNRPDIALGPLHISMAGSLQMFVVTFIVAMILLIVAVRITQSPFGQVTRAIRENEDRTLYLGYNTYHYKIFAFTIAGLYAGVGGALFAMYTQFAFLSLAFWKMSGELLMMVLIGGMGTLFGPVAGVYVFMVLRNVLSNILTEWQLLLGGLFVLIVLFSPSGLAGLASRIYEKFNDSRSK
jgi:branched-chain amino acid transport system permease protein